MELSERLLQAHRPPQPFSHGLDLQRLVAPIRAKSARRIFSEEAKQFADVTQAFGLLLENGLPVSVAIRWLEPRLSGVWQQNFRFLIDNLDLGADLIAELQGLSERMSLAEVIEFTQKLQISIERGTPSAHQISQLSHSIQQQVLRGLIKRAGENETKMLVPTIFLILPVTVLFAIYPSLLVLRTSGGF
jgi:tight adherence protein C